MRIEILTNQESIKPTAVPNVVLLVIATAAAAVVIAGFAVAVPVMGEQAKVQTSHSTVTYTPVKAVINGVPATIAIGSYTTSRAVIQLTAQTSAGKKLFESIQTAQIKTDRGTIPGTVTTGHLANGTWTLTIQFNPNRPIGEATLVVKTSNGTYSFKIAWPPTPGV